MHTALALPRTTVSCLPLIGLCSFLFDSAMFSLRFLSVLEKFFRCWALVSLRVLCWSRCSPAASVPSLFRSCVVSLVSALLPPLLCLALAISCAGGEALLEVVALATRCQSSPLLLHARPHRTPPPRSTAPHRSDRTLSAAPTLCLPSHSSDSQDSAHAHSMSKRAATEALLGPATVDVAAAAAAGAAPAAKKKKVKKEGGAADGTSGLSGLSAVGIEKKLVSLLGSNPKGLSHEEVCAGLKCMPSEMVDVINNLLNKVRGDTHSTHAAHTQKRAKTDAQSTHA